MQVYSYLMLSNIYNESTAGDDASVDGFMLVLSRWASNAVAGAENVKGWFLKDNQPKGCVVSPRVAQNLFGSHPLPV